MREREREREREIEKDRGRERRGEGETFAICVGRYTEEGWQEVSFIGEYMENSRKLHLLLIFHHVGFIF